MSGHHAIIAPSSMDRTVKCQAWIQLSQGLPPEPDTEETLEGNAADWVAKQYASGNEVAHGTPIPLPGGYIVDYDMIDGAKLWTKVLGYGAVSGVPVVCERIHPTDCWGEPDGWKYDGIEQVLRVPDYKYGYDLVEAFENWQTLTYASGLIDSLQLVDSEIMVECTIVQPRAFHKDGPVRKWLVRGDRLRALINIAHDAAVTAWPPEYNRGITPPPVAKTGRHCIHCPAKLVCAAYQENISTVLSLARPMNRVVMDEATVATQLTLVDEAMKLLEAQQTALRAQAEALIRGGKRVPGYCMEPTGSRLLWLDDVTADEVIALGQSLPKKVDLQRAPGKLNSNSGPLVTPTQAIKAGIDAAVISQYSHRPQGGMKLARESLTETRRIFGDNHA